MKDADKSYKLLIVLPLAFLWLIFTIVQRVSIKTIGFIGKSK